jgi:hypothetical protein
LVGVPTERVVPLDVARGHPFLPQRGGQQPCGFGKRPDGEIGQHRAGRPLARTRRVPVHPFPSCSVPSTPRDSPKKSRRTMMPIRAHPPISLFHARRLRGDRCHQFRTQPTVRRRFTCNLGKYHPCRKWVLSFLCLGHILRVTNFAVLLSNQRPFPRGRPHGTGLIFLSDIRPLLKLKAALPMARARAFWADTHRRFPESNSANLRAIPRNASSLVEPNNPSCYTQYAPPTLCLSGPVARFHAQSASRRLSHAAPACEADESLGAPQPKGGVMTDTA